MAIKQFSQTDPAWKNKLLGFDKTSTIGSYGCLLTSFTMCATHYGADDLTPDTLNEKMKAVGGFQAGTAFIIGGALGSVVPGMSVDYRKGAPLTEIDASLAQGRPVIIEADWSPQAGLQTHYMVVYAKDGDDYLIYDPYPFPVKNGEIRLSTSKYAQIAGSKDPARIITGCFFTRGPMKIEPPAPPKLDKGVYASFPVYATADELAIRSQPLVSDFTLLKRVAVNTEFKVLEADAVANAKIGQQNQWLAVKAPDGTEGYVAAWLVSRTKNAAAPEPGKPPAPVPVPKDAPVVKTNVDGLKLRSRPDNTEATILKMYPIGTELKVLEPASEVKRKVGVQFEWLKVADVEGKQGVVAAWYVSIVSLGAFGPEAQRQTAAPSFSVEEAPPLVLRALEDGVALRSKPFISQQTLITRLPKGAELLALGRQDTAAKRIGKTGKWIRVRDVKGNRGYVAAWLVAERPEDPAPQVSPKDC
ncbi:MAG: C39 family peptidase [Anaerolineales bacterium]|nr:C39 family peptidase [Anaerolineales bacterium]MCX7755795.1 C39 family peptidase [Anaerolineales bacterium]MDW8279268.1 C39 family peptidase [Anaerolineales bacterium]